MDGRILTVLDTAINCKPLLKHLRGLDYELVLAESGAHALNLAQASIFDVLLTGLNLADMSGSDLLSRFKSDPALANIPVLMIGDLKEAETVARCLELGAEDQVFPPFPLPLLRARLKTCLEKKRQREQEKVYIKRTKKLADDLRFVILPLGIALSAEKNFSRLLERILWEAKSLCNADAGTLYLATPDQRLEFAIMYTDSLNIALGGTTGKPISFEPLPIYQNGQPNHQNVSTHVALSGRSISIPNVYETEDFDFSATRLFDQHNHYRTISCLTVPLKNHDSQVIGVLQLINAQDPASGKIIAFEGYQQLVVESLSSQAAVALSNYMLLQRQKDLLRLEHDIQIGRKIQTGFLPDKLPELSGWELAAYFQPAREVSGDFYDVFPLSKGQIGVVIADVADKGVPAALFMALVRSLTRAFAEEHFSAQWMNITSPNGQKAGDSNETLRDTITLTNNYIAVTHTQLNMFATLFFGVLNTESGVLEYVNCGHIPPVVLDRQAAVKTHLQPTGPVIGIMPGIDLRIARLELQAGDTLLMYTDGVTDARAADGQFYGEERLNNIITWSYDSAEKLLHAIETAIFTHMGNAEQFDDITMLALRRTDQS